MTETLRRRTARTRTMMALVLALLMVFAPAAASSGHAATPSPTPTPSPTAGTGIVEFTLSPTGSGIVPTGSALTVAVTIQNGTALPAAATTVSLSLGSTAFPDRAALSTWLAASGSAALSGVSEVGTTALPPIAPQTEQSGVIQITADNPALSGKAPGVYPLVASYPTAAGTTTSTSALIIPAAPVSATPIGVVVPITAGPLSAGLLSSTELSRLTAADGALTTQLDAVAGTGVILAVDPAIPAAIRVLGNAAPASAELWLERLDALSNSRFALQFGDADVAVQLQTGLAAPAQPTSLSAYLRPADFTVSSSADEPSASPTESASQSPSPTPSPSTTAADPSTPVLPSAEELLAVGGRAGVYWPATGSAGATEVAALGALPSEDGQASLTLVSSRSTTAGGSGATVSARGTAAEASVLVYDADISAELRDASSRDDLSLRGASLTAASAYLAFAANETGGAPLLVTIDRSDTRSAIGLSAAIGAATQATGVTPVDIDAIADASPTPVQVPQVIADATRVAEAATLFATETEIARFATVLDDTTLLTGPERAEILQILGDGWLSEPDAWQSALADHRTASAKTLDSVGLLQPGTINLISKDAGLPVWVRNDLPYPITVVLYAAPNDLRLEVQSPIEVAAGASSNTSIKVPVQARVGNGEVTVGLQLRSRTFEPIGGPQTLPVNVHADWETIGVIGLAILAGAFVIFGLIRTILRRRRRRADAGGSVDEVISVDPDGSHDPASPATEEDRE